MLRRPVTFRRVYPGRVQDPGLREKVLHRSDHLIVRGFRFAAELATLDDNDVGRRRDKIRGLTDSFVKYFQVRMCQIGYLQSLTNGGLELVSGQYPHLDARALQVSDRLWHTILEFILDGSRPK